VRRHFPHQGEWLEGAARGSGLPLAVWVREASARLAAPPHGLLAWEADGAFVIGCGPLGAAGLRRVHPEGRFRSLELADPWLPAPWLGVNEAGLAVAACAGARSDGHRHAPAALFARDCLERFESVASALAWCLGRPAAPGGALLFADAAGELAGVELLASERRVRRPELGKLALGAEAPEARASADPRRRRLVWGGAELSLD
jgi:hypothetical protein